MKKCCNYTGSSILRLLLVAALINTPLACAPRYGSEGPYVLFDILPEGANVYAVDASRAAEEFPKLSWGQRAQAYVDRHKKFPSSIGFDTGRRLIKLDQRLQLPSKTWPLYAQMPERRDMLLVFIWGSINESTSQYRYFLWSGDSYVKENFLDISDK